MRTDFDIRAEADRVIALLQEQRAREGLELPGQPREGQSQVMKSSMVRLALTALLGLTLSACSQHRHGGSEALIQADAAGSLAQFSVTTSGDIRDAPFGKPTVAFPKALIGLWAVSPGVCQSLDGEGWVRIATNLLTGYEVAVRPLEIRSVGANAWVIESEENYLGTQFAKVSQLISLNDSALTVWPEGGLLERYIRCGL